MFSQDQLLVIYDNQYYKDCLLKITCWLLIIIMRIGYMVHKVAFFYFYTNESGFDICLFIFQKHTHSVPPLVCSICVF